jgi:hypothetical protein
MDGQARLPSVTFVDDMEMKRSYADGLIGVEGAAISFFTQPSPNRLVPFLNEERESYRTNYANRSAEALNLEVMPMYVCYSPLRSGMTSNAC